jgi:hypothetical protein
MNWLRLAGLPHNPFLDPQIRAELAKPAYTEDLDLEDTLNSTLRLRD